MRRRIPPLPQQLSSADFGGTSDNKAEDGSLLRFEGRRTTLLTAPEVWDHFLDAAANFGWLPQHPNMLYRADIGLRISVQDARNLADAWERWLLHVLRRTTDRTFPNRHLFVDELVVLINFCREGGFQIR